MKLSGRVRVVVAATGECLDWLEEALGRVSENFEAHVVDDVEGLITATDSELFDACLVSDGFCEPERLPVLIRAVRRVNRPVPVAVLVSRKVTWETAWSEHADQALAEGSSDSKLAEALESLLAKVADPCIAVCAMNPIEVCRGDALYWVRPRDISCIVWSAKESRKDVSVITVDGAYVWKKITMVEAARRLTASGFVMASRGCLVNIAHIKRAERMSSKRYALYVDFMDEPVVASKAQTRQIRSVLEHMGPLGARALQPLNLHRNRDERIEACAQELYELFDGADARRIPVVYHVERTERALSSKGLSLTAIGACAS